MSRDDSGRTFLTHAGQRLTQVQLDRRRFMRGLVGAGAFATLAGISSGRLVSAQGTASPAAGGTPTASGEPGYSMDAQPYAGDLAPDQSMRLPTGEPITLDPGVSYGDVELDILFQVFDGLVGVDQQTGEVVPRIAESWQANADATQYTFKIRQGVMFSDGSPLTAKDFVYSWQRVLDPDTLSQYTNALYPIKNAEAIDSGDMTPDQLGVQATDDSTLVVDLTGPTPYFPLLATTWTFAPVSQTVIEKFKEKWTEAPNLVGCGPFKMTEWSHNQQITLEPNENYYGDKPMLTTATYRIFKDASTQAYIAYQNNEIDYSEPEGSDLDGILADPAQKAELLEFPLSNTYFITCDTSNPPTDKQEFRQALSMAIDRDTLANTVLKGQFLPAPTMLPPDIAGNNPGAALQGGLDQAKQLLSTAGIDPASVDLQLTYVTSPDRYKTVAEFLQSTWQQGLGIKVSLNPIDSSSYSDWRAALVNNKFGAYTGTWGSDFADASNWFNQNFTSTSDHYHSHWMNDQFDQLCATAAVNTDTAQRDQQYSQAEALLIQGAPQIPMYRGKADRMIKPYVKDLYFQSVLSVPRLRTVKIAAH